MSNSIKLEKDHVHEIRGLREEISTNSHDISIVTKEIYIKNKELSELETTKTTLLQEFEALLAREQSLIDKLKKHYGDGQIDLNENVFTPAG